MPGVCLPRVPEGLRDMVKTYTKEVLRQKPPDLYDFSARYFEMIMCENLHAKGHKYEPQQSYEIIMKNRVRQQIPLSLVYNIIPGNLTDLIKQFIKAVLKENPENIYAFAVEFFQKLRLANTDRNEAMRYSEYDKFLETKNSTKRTKHRIKCECGRILGSTEEQENVIETNVVTVNKSSAQYMTSVYIIQRNIRKYLERKRTKVTQEMIPSKDIEKEMMIKSEQPSLAAETNRNSIANESGIKSNQLDLDDNGNQNGILSTNTYSSSQYIRAVFIIQRNFRNYLRKRNGNEVKNNNNLMGTSVYNEQYLKAIYIIQRQVRRYLTKRRQQGNQQQSESVEEGKEQVIITHDSAHYIKAVYVIQRCFRRYLRNKRNAETEKNNKISMTAAAFIIQKAFRRMVKSRRALKFDSSNANQGDEFNDNISEAASYTSASTALLSTESAGDLPGTNYDEGVLQETINEDEEVENDDNNLTYLEQSSEITKKNEKSINSVEKGFINGSQKVYDKLKSNHVNSVDSKVIDEIISKTNGFKDETKITKISKEKSSDKGKSEEKNEETSFENDKQNDVLGENVVESPKGKSVLPKEGNKTELNDTTLIQNDESVDKVTKSINLSNSQSLEDDSKSITEKDKGNDKSGNVEESRAELPDEEPSIEGIDGKNSLNSRSKIDDDIDPSLRNNIEKSESDKIISRSRRNISDELPLTNINSMEAKDSEVDKDNEIDSKAEIVINKSSEENIQNESSNDSQNEDVDLEDTESLILPDEIKTKDLSNENNTEEKLSSTLNSNDNESDLKPIDDYSNTSEGDNLENTLLLRETSSESSVQVSNIKGTEIENDKLKISESTEDDSKQVIASINDDESNHVLNNIQGEENPESPQSEVNEETIEKELEIIDTQVFQNLQSSEQNVDDENINKESESMKKDETTYDEKLTEDIVDETTADNVTEQLSEEDVNEKLNEDSKTEVHVNENPNEDSSSENSANEKLIEDSNIEVKASEKLNEGSKIANNVNEKLNKDSKIEDNVINKLKDDSKIEDNVQEKLNEDSEIEGNDNEKENSEIDNNLNKERNEDSKIEGKKEDVELPKISIDLAEAISDIENDTEDSNLEKSEDEKETLNEQHDEENDNLNKASKVDEIVAEADLEKTAIDTKDDANNNLDSNENSSHETEDENMEKSEKTAINDDLKKEKARPIEKIDSSASNDSMKNEDEEIQAESVDENIDITNNSNTNYNIDDNIDDNSNEKESSADSNGDNNNSIYDGNIENMVIDKQNSLNINDKDEDSNIETTFSEPQDGDSDNSKKEIQSEVQEVKDSNSSEISHSNKDNENEDISGNEKDLTKDDQVKQPRKMSPTYKEHSTEIDSLEAVLKTVHAEAKNGIVRPDSSSSKNAHEDVKESPETLPQDESITSANNVEDNEDIEKKIESLHFMHKKISNDSVDLNEHSIKIRSVLPGEDDYELNLDSDSSPTEETIFSKESFEGKGDNAKETKITETTDSSTRKRVDEVVEEAISNGETLTDPKAGAVEETDSVDKDENSASGPFSETNNESKEQVDTTSGTGDLDDSKANENGDSIEEIKSPISKSQDTQESEEPPKEPLGHTETVKEDDNKTSSSVDEEKPEIQTTNLKEEQEISTENKISSSNSNGNNTSEEKSVEPSAPSIEENNPSLHLSNQLIGTQNYTNTLNEIESNSKKSPHINAKDKKSTNIDSGRLLPTPIAELQLKSFKTPANAGPWYEVHMEPQEPKDENNMKTKDVNIHSQNVPAIENNKLQTKADSSVDLNSNDDENLIRKEVSTINQNPMTTNGSNLRSEDISTEENINNTIKTENVITDDNNNSNEDTERIEILSEVKNNSAVAERMEIISEIKETSTIEVNELELNKERAPTFYFGEEIKTNNPPKPKNSESFFVSFDDDEGKPKYKIPKKFLNKKSTTSPKDNSTKDINETETKPPMVNIEVEDVIDIGTEEDIIIEESFNDISMSKLQTIPELSESESISDIVSPDNRCIDPSVDQSSDFDIETLIKFAPSPPCTDLECSDDESDDNENEQHKSAATIIQRAYKKYKSRKNPDEDANSESQMADKKHKAALTIQKAIRNFLKTKYHHNQQTEDNVKDNQQKDYVSDNQKENNVTENKQEDNIADLEKNENLNSKFLSESSEDMAAKVIQKMVRFYLQRKKLENQKNLENQLESDKNRAVLKIQRAYRKFTQRKNDQQKLETDEEQTRVQELAAIVIQKAFRNYIVRKRADDEEDIGSLDSFDSSQITAIRNSSISSGLQTPEVSSLYAATAPSPESSSTSSISTAQESEVARPEWFVGSTRIVPSEVASTVVATRNPQVVDNLIENRSHDSLENTLDIGYHIHDQIEEKSQEYDNETSDNLAGTPIELEAFGVQQDDANTLTNQSEVDVVRDFLINEIEYNNQQNENNVEVIEEPCVKRKVSITTDDDDEEKEDARIPEDAEIQAELQNITSNLSDLVNDTEDGDNDTLDEAAQKLSKPDEVIEKMAQRRASEIRENILEKRFSEASFDEPVIRPMSSLQTTDSLDVEDGDVIVYNRLQREDTRESSAQSDSVVFGDTEYNASTAYDDERIPIRDNEQSKAQLMRHFTIAGDDPRGLFKSVTIDETVKYIEMDETETEVEGEGELEAFSGTSNSSFCLDDETSANIRKKMMAYSLSEADSDYFDPTKVATDDFHIDTAMGDTLETSTETESTIVSAATKIQAGARGFLTRRRMRRASAGTKSSTQETKASFGNDAISESLERFIEEEAAKKIQAAYRNHYKKRKVSRGHLHSASLENSLAARRQTLQRGDALRNDSTPDEEQNGQNISKPTKASVGTSGKSRSTAKSDNKLKWFALRQNSMPVQIDCEVLRVIPKHMKKRIKSAENGKKTRKSN